MLRIQIENIERIADEWYMLLNDFLTIRNYKSKMLSSISDSQLSQQEQSIGIGLVMSYFTNLKYYVVADEQELMYQHELYNNCFLGMHKNRYEKLHKKLAHIFSNLYTAFTKYEPANLIYPIAYHFFYKLDIRTCPYCNRSYTFTVYKYSGKKTRPEYDHFYDKANNPLLALSFYNLVPSCHDCNRIKSTDTININPYFRKFRGRFKIYEQPRKDSIPQPLNAIELLKADHWGDIRLDTNSQMERNDMATFALDELYKNHSDYIREIVINAQAYSTHARAALVTSFQGAGHSPDQVYDFVWGKDLETANQINRPLSKLTRDILDQLEIQ